MSPRTKKVRKLRNIFAALSTILWIGTALVLVAIVFSKLALTSKDATVTEATKATASILSEEVKNLLLSISTTAVIGILGTILIKDKMRTFIWMLNLVVCTVLYKETGMYVILVLWFLDEYILYSLYKHYKHLVVINKEIDRR